MLFRLKLTCCAGLFCAISEDEGNSFARRRLVSDDGDGTVLEALDGALFTMGRTTAEPNGYTGMGPT